jgi:hypothetical protein
VGWNQWRGQGEAVVASGTAAGTKLRKT